MTNRRTAAAVITAVSTATAVAVTMPAQAASNAHHQPRGVYVAGEGLVSRGMHPAAFVNDRNNKQHLVTVKPTTGANGKFVYKTKKSGASKWTSHSIPGARPLRHLHIEAHLSSNGSRVFVVFYQCNGVYAVDAPLSAGRLPEPMLVKAEANCGTDAVDPYVTTAGVPIQRAAADRSYGGADGDHFGVLLYDADVPAGSEKPVGWTVYYGTPSASTGGGSDFNPTGSILGADSALRPQQLVTDPRTFRTTVIATGTQDGHAGVFAITHTSPTTWGSVEIATLGAATANYTIDSSLAFNRRVYVGLQRPDSFARKSALYLVKGSPGGIWSGAFPLAHTTPADAYLLIAKNTATNHLHAVFTRRNGRHVGLMAEMQPQGGGWTKPVSFSKSHLDRAIALYVTPHGRNVIAYRHF